MNGKLARGLRLGKGRGFFLSGLGLSSLLCFALSCGRSHEETKGSEPREGTDRNNRFELLGMKELATYDELRKIDFVEVERKPWTDTYWPFTSKGVSRRWDLRDPNDERDAFVWPSAYFRTHAEATNSPWVNPLLSPAEKYDVVYRWRHGINLDWFRLWSAIEPMFGVEEQLRFSEKISDKRGLVAQLNEQFKGESGQTFQTFFPMTSDGWKSWLTFTSDPRYRYLAKKETGEDWHWMGYCHGWAPAAIMAATPKHGVMARIGGQQVLFTEGDIRGLLTKSWADYWPAKDMYFLGRRCNKNVEEPNGEIPHGAAGRGVYGMIRFAEAEPEQPFYVKAEYFTNFTRPNERIYPVTFEGRSSPEGFLLERYYGQSNSFSYIFASTLEALQNYIEKDSREGLRYPYLVEMYGCWDVNPASFHMTVLEKIGKEKVGFVIDRTRTGQVWNQPVTEAKFVFSDLKLASEARDVAAEFRAPGTKYLLEVTADVKWLSEPTKPRLVYSPTFDQRYTITTRYQYTLEFDRQKRLIGGEWGTLDKVSPKQMTPDFIFGFTKDSKPFDNLEKGFDYSGIIEKIHACSLSEDVSGSVTVQGQQVRYKDCVIESAP